MLNKHQFAILNYCRAHVGTSQRAMASALDLSVGTVNSVLKSCREAGWLKENNALTSSGLDALEPYHVKNAIILAAGMSSRCAPLSFEKPKGLFRVRGEVLIERQIRQLREHGINEIYVVVGYMKELFFYLEEKMGVHIVTNTEYTVRNNLSSIYAVKEHFGNSFVCYSDNYILENGYEPYVYDSYYAAMYSEGYTDEYVMECNSSGLIQQYYQGGEHCWYQMGEMYFTMDTAAKFLELLEREYQYPAIFDMKIDDFYIRHLAELPIYIKKCSPTFVREFDTVMEIEAFDDHFIQNMGENILTNICSTLSCSTEDITQVKQIKLGHTNTIFSFVCKGERYIYRHPGRGTEKIIDRTKEAYAQSLAQKYGLDPTLVRSNPEKGWKISHFIENVPFDYANPLDEDRAVELLRKLHSTHETLGWSFHMMDRAAYMQSIVSQDYYDAYSTFRDLRDMITRLYEHTQKDGYPLEMCHNDACDTNILLGRTGVYLIDWEYAGDNDPASDIASFIIGCRHTREDVDRILKKYFQRVLTPEERRHYYAYIAISAYFYFSWSIYMQSTGQEIGELTYIWYQYLQEYGRLALNLYEQEASSHV